MDPWQGFVLILSQSLINGKVSSPDSASSFSSELHRAVVKDFGPGPKVSPSFDDAANR
jgi:hypothetical protein